MVDHLCFFKYFDTKFIYKNVHCLAFWALCIQISISYDLIIAAFFNFNRSLKGAAKCSDMIFVTIGTQHHSKTAILILCARVVHGQTCVLTFNIAYSMLHKISFRMSGRSSLCDVWFLKHFDTNLIYIYISQKPKSSVVWVGETWLLFSFQKLWNIWSQGRLIY